MEKPFIRKIIDYKINFYTHLFSQIFPLLILLFDGVFKDALTFLLVAHLCEKIRSLHESAATPSNISKQKVMELLENFLTPFSSACLLTTGMAHLANYNPPLAKLPAARIARLSV